MDAAGYIEILFLVAKKEAIIRFSIALNVEVKKEMPVGIS